jgi:hypothetical protein
MKRADFPFYAVGERGLTAAKQASPGDRAVLYVAGSVDCGFVGTFDLTSGVSTGGPRVFVRPLPNRLFWQPRTLLDRALPLRSCVQQLDFIKNKKNYGMAFRANIRELSVHDFEYLEDLMRLSKGTD